MMHSETVTSPVIQLSIGETRNSTGIEPIEENSKNLILYFQNLAGCIDVESNAILKDHCYARPWNWKPESIYVKPVKKIFFPKKKHSKRNELDDGIDIETLDIASNESSLFSSLSNSRPKMDECQKLANFARPDSNDDWDEKIDKTLWSGVQTRLWSRVYKILTGDYLSRLCKSTSNIEPINRRMSIDSTAKRFRQVFASTGYDWKLIQWLHSLLFDILPKEYLVIYLDVLQTLKGKIPQLIDKIIATQPNIPTKSGVINWETLGSLLKRTWDPLAITLNTNRPKKLPGNPILIIVPSGIGNNTLIQQGKWISQLSCLGMVVNINSHLGIAGNRMNMTSCMDQLVQTTRSKIQEVRGDFPGRPLILIGFNCGAALACQIAQVEHLTAVICLGFPFSTVEGRRGAPDDMLMDMRCPVMFIIGQNASIVRPDDLEEIREKMLVETSLVVIGTADDHLRISTRKKNTEGITQSIVDRCVLDEISNFIGEILLQPHPLPLRHIGLLNYDKNFKKESRKRKNSTSSSVDSSDINITNFGKRFRPLTPTNFTSTAAITTSNTANTSSNGYAALNRNIKSRNSLHRQISITNNHNNDSPNNNDDVSNNNDNNNNSHNNNHNNNNNNDDSNHGDDNENDDTIDLRSPSNNGNGGITVNIGSLASLTPIGPIKLTPTSVNRSRETIAKHSSSCKSPVLLSKLPKNNNDETNFSNFAANKNFGKLIENPFKVVDTQQKSRKKPKDYQLITNLSTTGIHMRNNESSLSATDLTSSITTAESVTALIQNGKTAATNESSNLLLGKNVSRSKVSIISNETSTIVSFAPTIPSVNKVLENSNPDINNRKGMVADIPKYGQNLSNQDFLTIIPVMHRRTNTKEVTRNCNNLRKNQRYESRTKHIENEFGNILDIPIIFAKDDENLKVLEKVSSLSADMKASSELTFCETNTSTGIRKPSNESTNSIRNDIVQVALSTSDEVKRFNLNSPSVLHMTPLTPIKMRDRNAFQSLNKKIIFTKKNTIISGDPNQLVSTKKLGTLTTTLPHNYKNDHCHHYSSIETALKRPRN